MVIPIQFSDRILPNDTALLVLPRTDAESSSAQNKDRNRNRDRDRVQRKLVVEKPAAVN